MLTVEGDLINRCEVFDDADLDAAVARLDELSRPARRLENAASRMYVRFNAYLAARDWDAMVEMLADDVCDDDRRRVVSGGLQRGRDAQIANLRAVVGVGVRNIELVVIATRGERLALSRARVSGGDQQAEAFGLEMLSIVEIDTDDRIAAGISFDVDDIGSAFAELDSRYLAGEAALCAQTWSVIVRNTAAFNRRELPPSTPDWVNIDHRRGTSFAPGDLTAYLGAAWDLTPQIDICIETVHRLSNLGAVVVHAAHGTSQDGFAADWRVVSLLMLDGDLISRSEMFDEADLDAALARFDELSLRAPQLENAATQTWARAAAAFNCHDVDGFLALLCPDGRFDDRRKGLSAIHEGPERRNAVHALFEVAATGWRLELEPIAIRGSRLALTRQRSRDTGDADRPITAELLTVIEIGDGDLVHDTASFDPDDIGAAFEELDARYVAGEAADHARTWSVVAESFAALNRHELPAMTADCVQIDHRPLVTMETGNMAAHIRAFLDEMPNLSIYIEAVQRLTHHGAVFTHAARGASQQGFDAEWRMIELVTVVGDLINRCELFDEADLDAALARFDDLSRPSIADVVRSDDQDDPRPTRQVDLP